jgi:hypothetical protein
VSVMPPPVTCSDFDTDSAELALGLLTDPRRSALVEHAVACRRCQARLDDLVAVGDRLVLLAPQVDPPAGFETRALSRMGGPVAADLRWARRSRILTGVAALVATLALGMLVGRLVSSPGATTVDRVAAIHNAAGDVVGDAHLENAPRPHILVSVLRAPTKPGVRTCELQRPDGSWVVVGTWTAEELSTGVWAVALDPALLRAQAMRVTNEDGALLATARFAAA